MPLDMEHARFAMVEQQIRPWEVLDPRVLDTLSTLKREDFVPARHRKLAFADVALPLEHGEFMFKPVLEGRVLQSIALQATDEVLEVGTGSAFLTACLAQLARAVTSIERHADLVERARQRLEATGLTNVRVECADAFTYQPGREFDVVVITAAVCELPTHFASWVRQGGRLFVITGDSPAQEAVLLTRTAAGWQRESLFDTDVPYLYGAEPKPEFVL
ncbi:MAG: Protein-L-isoaspartate O-methyltransferase [Alphaproteobacteria bacterium ADurb.BinA280]|jgi:protein-L-isoaspartate(D-aspartate) O-methyltransferase|nr:protein-L-isoaspartate O-methyltransferase [Xanthomonadales bacterium]MCC6504731.1 protein-L-isoaspartate O-methyltransferase [Aquimonas sp.]OPZ12394.1 MAG: Protein-L-isoaspartate O-methyltransferase [Alphaproteobacteria bacterium ADurb.BinA280]